MSRAIVITLAAAIVLAACATLSRDECASGDWHKIGLQDGTDGRTVDRFNDHVKACKLDRSEASRATYLAARKQGLVTYCTTVRGYREGALGQKYHGVCSPETAGAFLTGYELGKSILQVESRASDVIEAYHEINNKLQAPSLPEAERAPLIQERDRLLAEDARLKEEIARLRSQADTLVAAARKKPNSNAAQ